MLLAYDLAAGSEVDLEFLVPVSGKQESQVFAFRGEVVGSRPINKAQYIIGMQFLNGSFPMDLLG